jgi:hypothetical protein
LSGKYRVIEYKVSGCAKLQQNNFFGIFSLKIHRKILVKKAKESNFLGIFSKENHGKILVKKL